MQASGRSILELLRERINRLSDHRLAQPLRDQLRILQRIDEDPPGLFEPGELLGEWNDELTRWERAHLSARLGEWIDRIEQNIAAEASGVRELNVRDFGAVGDGKTDDLPAINRAVLALADAGGRACLFFPHGRYRMMPPEGAREHLHLVGLRNVILRGETGTELLGGGRAALLRAKNCINLRFEQLAFDYDPPLFSQGTVTQIADDRRSFTWEIDQGYPAPDAPLFEGLPTIAAIALDDSERFIPKSHGGFAIEQWRHTALRRWQLMLPASAALEDRIQRGTRVLLYRRYRWMQAVVFSACEWIDLASIEIWGAPEFAMFMESCTGMCLRNCHVRVKPGSGRLGGLNADGIHARSCRYGPMLYGCTVTRVQDDCLNFQSRMVSVDDVIDDRSLVIDTAWNAEDRIGYWSPTRGDFVPGDMIALLNPTTAELTGFAKIDSVQAHPWHDAVRTLVKLDRPIPDVVSRQSLGKLQTVQSSSEFLSLQTPEPVEHFVVNASTKSDGFVIRGCSLGDNTVTGGKIKAGNGLIVDNRTFNHGWCVFSFATEFVWQEGYAARRILVENNHFENWFGIFLGSYNLFRKYHQGTPLNYRVEITGNTFAGTHPGQYAVDINGTIGCTLRENQFVTDRPVTVGPTARSVHIASNKPPT